MIRNNRAVLIATILALAAWGCSGSQGDADADAGCDAGLDVDGHAGWDLPPADYGLDGGFGVQVPMQTSACSIGLGRALDEQLLCKARVALRSGLIRLPRDADFIEAELIERLELGPGYDDPAPDGPGGFSRSVVGTPDDGVTVFVFEQAYRSGDRELAVSMRLPFEVHGGVAEQPLRTLDEQGMLALLAGVDGWLQVSFTSGEELHTFCACAPRSARTNSYRIGLEDGSVLQLDEWMTELPGWFMFCPTDLVAATWEQGTTSRTVDDFWLLSYMPGNHNILESFAVRFDPPVGELHGLIVHTQCLGMPLEDLTLVYELEADLTTGAELPVASVTYTGTPCNMPGP